MRDDSKEDPAGFLEEKTGDDMERIDNGNETHQGAEASAKACMKARELKLEAAEILKVR